MHFDEANMNPIRIKSYMCVLLWGGGGGGRGVRAGFANCNAFTCSGSKSQDEQEFHFNTTLLSDHPRG